MQSELKRRNGGLGAKTEDAGILGCGEPGKNPLPALELCEGARDLLKVRLGGCGWPVVGGVGIVAVKAPFFGYFFWRSKKSNSAGRHEIMVLGFN